MKNYDNLVAYYGHGESDVELLPAVQKLASQNELPKIVSVILTSVNHESLLQETHNALKKAAKLAETAPLAVICGALNVSVLRGSFYKGWGSANFDSDFYGITPEYWGAKSQLPCFIARAILKDLSDGIDVENPSEKDLSESELMDVWKTFFLYAKM